MLASARGELVARERDGTWKQFWKSLAESEVWNYTLYVSEVAQAAGHGSRGGRGPHGGRASPLARALDAVGDRWTLLIVLALAERPLRPVQLRGRLAGISAAGLDRQLQRMVALGLLLRARYKEMPPRVEFALTETGRELLPIADALARWAGGA